MLLDQNINESFWKIAGSRGFTDSREPNGLNSNLKDFAKTFCNLHD